MLAARNKLRNDVARMFADHDAMTERLAKMQRRGGAA
jgi:hypothetical protein